MNIETFIESQFPLADNTAKRATRTAYNALRAVSMILTTATLPIALDYNAKLEGLRASHSDALDDLVVLGFEVDRRAA